MVFIFSVDRFDAVFVSSERSSVSYRTQFMLLTHADYVLCLRLHTADPQFVRAIIIFFPLIRPDMLVIMMLSTFLR